MRTKAWIALLVIVPAAAAFAAPAEAWRFEILESVDREYLDLAVPPRVRTEPGAGTRMVLLRGDRVVLDRGLRQDRALVDGHYEDGTRFVREEGYVERGYVSSDRRTGIVVGSTYLLRRSADRLGLLDPETDRPLGGESSLTWIDPASGRGAWTVTFGENRLVTDVLPLEDGRGVAVTTARIDGEEPDFRLFDPAGGILSFLSGLRAEVLEIRSVAHGAFLAVDMAYGGLGAGPDRGILVLDLLAGGRWTYTWRYGSSREPLRWEMKDSGILEIFTTDREFRFDRFGRILESRKLRR